jgi:hypothetical protein
LANYSNSPDSNKIKLDFLPFKMPIKSVQSHIWPNGLEKKEPNLDGNSKMGQCPIWWQLKLLVGSAILLMKKIRAEKCTWHTDISVKGTMAHGASPPPSPSVLIAIKGGGVGGIANF